MEEDINLYEKFYGYRRGYELFDFMIQDRIFIENMSDDILKNSIYILRNEIKKRKKEDFKLAFALLFRDYRDI